MDIKLKNINRRSFIKTLSCAGAGAMLAPGNIFAAGQNDNLEKAVYSRLAMGTTVAITVLYKKGSDYKKAIEASYAEIRRLSAIMNHFKDNSQLSTLNSTGLLKGADKSLLEVMKNALKYYDMTDGVFDVTIGPIIELFRESFSKRNSPPTGDEINKTLVYVGSDKIEINGSDIRLKKKGMKVTLDALGKGYIADRASDVLLSFGIKNHLINAGGDIKAVGLRKDSSPWKVAIQDPKKKANYIDVIAMTDAAVATSGNYENYYDAEKMYHHIANPKTGLSPVLNSSASIIAPSAMEADALATTLLIMSPDYGAGFINSLPECESMVITRDGKIKKSSGWKSLK